MKVIVTGSNGFVAGSIIAQAPDDWEIHGIARTEQIGNENNVTYHQLDLLDFEKLEAILEEIKPDAVIHTAAMANIDFCEANKEAAEKTNAGVTDTLARLCAKIGAKLVFCSTDTVFDGKKGNYSENDYPGAVNFYAETKIKAEQIVLLASNKNVVARLSLVMGLSVKGKGNSFLADMLEKLQKGEEMKFPENEIRTPVDVISLGSALIELAGNDFAGIIHLAGNTGINRYKMAQEIARELNFSEAVIIPVNSNAMPGRAPRPDNATMDNTLAKKILKTPMKSLSEGLALTLNFKTEI
ncbi:SDR family oxidoreductase [Dyadobacter frigoris]|uniref:dTDP-4-dehydrorhamnose reductase n=1 Tax=Dyadobacter frigoris TaxID=2576211 RepID=A0A4U6D3N6_9BACT|nr:NAD(P)-dependent oxidoreductase [Dyadobacter frigoris]TKT91900.1 NAD(P)-dependent oxidoreductase [Dyadobacter frigoris]GLU53230.1 NAD(P)-dependent oxidoreductase [Dyadobacter frigoris]